MIMPLITGPGHVFQKYKFQYQVLGYKSYSEQEVQKIKPTDCSPVGLPRTTEGSLCLVNTSKKGRKGKQNWFVFVFSNVTIEYTLYAIYLMENILYNSLRGIFPNSPCQHPEKGIPNTISIEEGTIKHNKVRKNVSYKFIYIK